jgi:hypothetical protein
VWWCGYISDMKSLLEQFPQPFELCLIDVNDVKRAVFRDNMGILLKPSEAIPLLRHLLVEYSVLEGAEAGFEKANSETRATHGHVDDRDESQSESVSKTVSGFVYVFKFYGFYKIGCTTNVERRAADLFANHPIKPELIWVIHSDEHTKLERRLHCMFAKKRRDGEWFELDEFDLEELKGCGGKSPN